MNQFIKAQIINMVNMTKTFEQACKLAAVKDDGVVSKDEEKDLKKIQKATAEFRKELTRLVD